MYRAGYERLLAKLLQDPICETVFDEDTIPQRLLGFKIGHCN